MVRFSKYIVILIFFKENCSLTINFVTKFCPTNNLTVRLLKYVVILNFLKVIVVSFTTNSVDKLFSNF